MNEGLSDCVCDCGTWPATSDLSVVVLNCKDIEQKPLICYIPFLIYTKNLILVSNTCYYQIEHLPTISCICLTFVDLDLFCARLAVFLFKVERSRCG